MKKYLIYIILLLPSGVMAQGQLGFYDLEGRVPQTNLLNPAFVPEAKVVVGFPGFGSFSVFADADRLSLRRMVKKDGDSLIIDQDYIAKNLKKKNRFEVGIDANVFYLGLLAKKNFITVSASDKVFGTLLLPRQAIEWALFGPADPRNSNETFDLSNLGGSVVAYHEFAVGFSRKVLQGRLTIGGRIKYLNGIAEASFRDVSGYLYAGIDSIAIHHGPFTLNTAGFSGFDANADQVIFGFSNPGLAIDLGAQFKLNDKISFSGSLTDVGFIKWKNFTRAYEVNGVDYTFKGFDVLDIINGQDVFQQELDSLQNLYDNPTEVDGNSYKTTLVKKLYLGGRYQFDRMQHVSLTMYNDFFEGSVKTAIGATYGIKVGRSLDAFLGLTYRDRSLANISLGTAFSLGFFQIYFVSENINSIYVDRARKLDFHMGMNLQFGRKKRKSV